MERRKLSLGAALAVMSLSAAPAGAQVAAPPLPPVSGCQISALDADSVLVRGTVDPALGTRFQVEYGLLGLLNLESLTLNVGSASDPTAVSTQLDGLVAGGSYGCRIAAVNAAGVEIPGLIMTFLVPAGSSGAGGSGGSDGSGASNGSSGSNGSGGSGATPTVNPVTGQAVPAGTPGAVKCTLAGTAGKDRLKGTRRADVICGLGAADRIVGLAGNDTLIGGSGNDLIKGNGGRDRILGNQGKDKLLGGKGMDKLDGSAGADKLVGWKGRDRMSGGRANDRFVANRDRRGGDRLKGGKGRDRASVNRGDQTVSVEQRRVMSR